ncbi:MAG: hypothetical protein IJC26_02355 [Clostridia bacterium]|nr:hypothetical protein [Clostridia bacterium]
MKIGFGKVDVTPPLGSGLAGYFHVRESIGILDPIYLTAVVIEAREERIAVITGDFLSMYLTQATEIRSLIAGETGIPEEHILMQALHQHTSTGTSKVPDFYKENLKRKYVDVVKLALDDLAECRVTVAEKETAEPVSFIRRYRMKDGSVMTNPGFLNPDIDHPLGKADNTVRLVRFHREGKGDIAMVGFQTHPDTLGGNRFSADWPGFVRRTVEKKLEDEGVRCILVNGCQGDTNHFNVSRPKPPASTAERYEKVTRLIGETIAAAALDVWNEGKAVEEGPISGEVTLHTIRTNWDGIEQIEEAKEIMRLLAEKLPTPRPLDLAERGRYARLARLENAALFQKVNVTMVAFGKVAIVGYSGEPFTEYADVLRKAFPELFILTACNCNGAQGYLPSAAAFDEGGYEANSSAFTPITPGLLQNEAKEKLQRHLKKL